MSCYSRLLVTLFLLLCSGVASAAPKKAFSFIYPVRGVSINEGDIFHNISDPRHDGWKTSGNEYGNYYCGAEGHPYCYHPGEDWNLISDQDEGEPVYAIANGIVVNGTKDYGSLKHGVIISHELPVEEDLSKYIKSGTSLLESKSLFFYSGYMHLKNVSVKKGDFVSVGQKIGEITNPGGGSHLHFEIKRSNTGSFPHYTTNLQAPPSWLHSPVRAVGTDCSQQPNLKMLQ